MEGVLGASTFLEIFGERERAKYLSFLRAFVVERPKES